MVGEDLYMRSLRSRMRNNIRARMSILIYTLIAFAQHGVGGVTRLSIGLGYLALGIYRSAGKGHWHSCGGVLGETRYPYHCCSCNRLYVRIVLTTNIKTLAYMMRSARSFPCSHFIDTCCSILLPIVRWQLKTSVCSSCSAVIQS